MLLTLSIVAAVLALAGGAVLSIIVTVASKTFFERAMIRHEVEEYLKCAILVSNDGQLQTRLARLGEVLTDPKTDAFGKDSILSGHVTRYKAGIVAQNSGDSTRAA